MSINEIALRAMKSKACAFDEIHPPAVEADFIPAGDFMLRSNISPTRVDLVEKTSHKRGFFMEAPSRIELEMAILQTAALPLGYDALYL